MANPTSGPWKAVAKHEQLQVVASDDRETIIAEVTGISLNPQVVADAHLIAAAPDGFALAEEFLAFARSGAAFNYPPGSLQKLEQFVAKAKGGI